MSASPARAEDLFGLIDAMIHYYGLTNVLLAVVARVIGVVDGDARTDKAIEELKAAVRAGAPMDKAIEELKAAVRAGAWTDKAVEELKTAVREDT